MALRHAAVHVLDGRHPAARRLLRQALRLHGRRRGQALSCPAVLGVLASVVAAYYYLRIVKVMYFDEPAEALDRAGRSASIAPWPSSAAVLLRRLLAGAAAAQPDRRGRGQGPVPVSSAPVLPDGWTAGRARQRRQHQRRGRAPGRGRRAGRHRRLGARADRRPRPARPRLGLADRQSLQLDHRCGPTARRRAPPSSASSRPWPWPTSCRPAATVRLKWPNDVLVDGGKVAGILLESAIGQGGTVEHVVAGHRRQCRLRPAAAGDALSRRGARRHGRGGAGEARRRRWPRGSPSGGATASRPCAPHWLAKAGPLGAEVDVRLGDELVRGRFAGLDRRGRPAAGTAGRSAPDRVG